jgi:DNA-binding response OmpR family regulator
MELARVERTILDGVKVLVVEDDFIIAMGIEDTLRTAGAEIVGPAGSLSSALRLVSTPHLTCALLDVRLGMESALPVARRLVERRVPFALYTGQLAGELEADWPKVPLLSKPTSPRGLLAAVRQLLSINETQK